MNVASEPAATRRFVVGVTGSSAPHLGYRLLLALQQIDEIETHLVISRGARLSIPSELDLDAHDFEALADVVHDIGNLGASISSGSFRTLGMAVIPCSMRTLGAIASGTGGDLITRAADVSLKERRPLVLVTRETPLNLIHLRNMETVTLAGATVLPPVPAFYHRPRTIDDLLDQTVGKVLDQFNIDHELFQRWE
jgi:polyprenyl P-hydroxybenzoate/phenylacrylic acid decarboxylase-like protein